MGKFRMQSQNGNEFGMKLIIGNRKNVIYDRSIASSRMWRDNIIRWE